jgi:PEGA domain
VRWGAAGATALIAIGVASAHAQTPDPDALDQRGIALRRQRRDAEALEQFRRSFALRAAPRTLAQIGLAEQALGRWVEAETDVHAALEASGDPWIARNRPILVAGLADIERHLGAIVVEADVPGAQLWVNGSRAAKLPLRGPLRVEAGSVVIEVRADGFAPARRITSVEPGENAHENVHLVPLSLEPSIAPSPKTPEQGKPVPMPAVPAVGDGLEVHVDRALRAASFVAIGAGVAGMSVGSYFGVRALSTKADRDRACPTAICSAPAGVALDHDVRWQATQSTAWFTFGIAAAGAGVGMFLLSPPSAARGQPTATHWALDVGSGGASALFGGSW